MRVTVSILLIALSVVVAAKGVTAQPSGIEFTNSAVVVCELSAQVASGLRSSHPVISTPVVSNAHESATFEVTYNGFPAEAEAAFQAAVDIWEQHITSPTPIRINANWTNLGSNILGSAGPFLIRNFSGAPIPNTWYPAPLADALSGRDLDPARADIEATFNSAFPNWYFGTDGNPPPNEYDLTTIVLHEIGHGLGFIGSLRVDRGLGTVGVPSDPGIPFVYDRFAEDEVGRPLLDASAYPQNSTALAFALQTDVRIGGGAVQATNEGPAHLYSPPDWSDGTSFSHLDEMAFAEGDVDALMTPFLLRAEVIRSPGPLACALMLDMGWVLTPTCAALVQEPDPAPTVPNGYTLAFAGPNPVLTETELRITVEQSQAVRIYLIDRIGQVVWQQDRFVQGGGTASLFIEVSELPAGVYFARFVGDTFSVTQAVTKLR